MLFMKFIPFKFDNVIGFASYQIITLRMHDWPTTDVCKILSSHCLVCCIRGIGISETTKQKLTS